MEVRSSDAMVQGLFIDSFSAVIVTDRKFVNASEVCLTNSKYKETLSIHATITKPFRLNLIPRKGKGKEAASMIIYIPA